MRQYHAYAYIWLHILCVPHGLVFCLLVFGHAAQLVGSQIPDQGLNMGPQQRKHGILTSGLAGNSL